MVSKWAQDERRRRKAEQAAQISEFDREALDLAGKLRLHVGGCQFRDDPRGVASYELWQAIEKWSETVTGKREYFWDVRNGGG